MAFRTTGAMGLPFHVVGDLAQSAADALVDRGHDRMAVTLRLSQWANEGNETYWWEDYGRPLVDDLARSLGLDRFPE